ncbi:hypothetical protein OG871_38995 [Kitasatospora sp. NBC_00374]|uniref:hypothetical protein n=1 Tax=Kitasatospora sp. NBC_00374 TaxID=2975964 RepID=UPI0030E17DA5
MPSITALLTGPVHAPHAAFPELARLRSAAVAGNWSSVSTVFAGLDGDDAAVASQVVAESPGADTMLEAALAASGEGPDKVLARSLLAHHHIATGWRIRTHARARYVSREQFTRFHGHLRQAELLLADAVSVDPGHTLGWYLQLMTARGLQLGQGEARRRYDSLAAVDPRHYRAQSQFLQQLCPKWGGNWEAAHAFARKCGRTAAPGGLGHLITVEAHLEHWMWAAEKADLTYWGRPGVRETLAKAAAASVWHPDFRPGFSWIKAHTALAAAFALSGRHAAAAPHFAALGGFSDTYPWSSVSGLYWLLWRRHRIAALIAAPFAKPVSAPATA